MNPVLRLISEWDVERLVEPSVAIDLAAEAFIAQASGALVAPGRADVRKLQPKAGMLVLAGFGEDRLAIVKSNMHAYAGEAAGRKTASLLAVWDMAECVPLALISSVAFNGHRTASGFAAAARVLAPPNARTLAVIGTGHLAPWTIRYLVRVRGIERVAVVGRQLEQAKAMISRIASESELRHVTLVAEADPARASGEADIVAAVTSADEPVFPGAKIKRGALVILGGANRSNAREADDALMGRATVLVDHSAGCLEKAGDVRLGLASGALNEQRMVGEIGALLAGTLELPPHDVIVFKSIGIAPQDLHLARYILRRAQEVGAGTLYDPRTGMIEGRV